MAATSPEKKHSLKLLVDIKAKRVVFAEADKEFVDFIFSLMTSPLSTVTKVLLLNKKGMVGSFSSLYSSIASLETRYFESDMKSDSVLKPKATVTVPLLSLHELPVSTRRIFKCSRATHNIISDIPGACATCGAGMIEMNYTSTAPKKTAPGFVKGEVAYMVMDNLEVKPMSLALIRSLVKDFDVLEEKQVQVGLQEGLGILKASLETNAVLTKVFLRTI